MDICLMLRRNGIEILVDFWVNGAEVNIGSRSAIQQSDFNTTTLDIASLQLIVKVAEIVKELKL